MADLVEDLLQTINIISEKQVKSLSFDITIEATIIDDSSASDGKYYVSNGNSSFEAYSTEINYKKDDVVLVTIPQGDYSKQKMIIGKQKDQTDTPLVYKSPFEQFINVSNNLISGNKELSIRANMTEQQEDSYCWDQNTKNFVDSITTIREGKRVLKVDPWWDSDKEQGLTVSESRYTRIGLKAQFSTWLNEYNTAYGNYGLALLLTFKNTDSSISFDQIITFDSSDFFGNVYNFETFYTQEILLDISEYVQLYALSRIRLFAYQRNNFEDAEGNRIYDYDENSFSSILPNIFIKDPYISLGIPTDNFESDTAIILMNQSKNYSKNITEVLPNTLEGAQRLYNNQKILGLQWIHKDAKTGKIGTVLPNEIPENYHIYWYRYKLGAPSPDSFAGAHWERFYGSKDALKVIEVQNSQEDLTKTVVGYEQTVFDPNEEYNITEKEYQDNKDLDTATDYIDNIIFYPNINKQSEQIKAVIVKEEFSVTMSDSTEEENSLRLIATTPIIEFINDVDVRSQATFIDTNALSIKYEDSERGNYFLYNRAGKLSKEKSQEMHVLTAVFDTKEDNVYKKANLTQPYSYIKWSFPASGSMIIPMTGTEGNPQVLTQNSQSLNEAQSFYGATRVEYNEIDDSFDFIFEQSTEENATNLENRLVSIGYTINSILNHNANRNIVNLEVVKDGESYLASTQMRFGTAGTSGSDYTLAVLWDNGDNAFDISKGEMSGQVCLFDQNGQLVQPESDASYIIDWGLVRAVTTNENNNTITENTFKTAVETRDLYYPIRNNALQELQGVNVSYFANSSVNSNNEITYNNISNDFDEAYYYNLIRNDFEKCGAKPYNADALAYAKSLEKNRKKLAFQAFSEVKQQNDKAGQVLTENGKRVYYYSNTRRAFIKYNNVFIIDPWSEYQPNETYYEPIYSPEKDYNSGSNLFINQNIDDNSCFTITGNPNIENDIYVLRVTLTHFGDYNLVAHFPIPLKNGDKNNNHKYESYVVDWVEGPSDIRYASSGEIDYNKNPYQITFRYLTQNPAEIYINLIKALQILNNKLFNKQLTKEKYQQDLQNLIEEYSSIEELPKIEDNEHILNLFDIKEEYYHKKNILVNQYNSSTMSTLEYNDRLNIINLEYSHALMNFAIQHPSLVSQNNDFYNPKITYKKKRQGYNEKKENIDEIFGHWEIVYKEDDTGKSFIPFLIESSDVNIEDIIINNEGYIFIGKITSEEFNQEEEKYYIKNQNGSMSEATSFNQNVDYYLKDTEEITTWNDYLTTLQFYKNHIEHAAYDDIKYDIALINDQLIDIRKAIAQLEKIPKKIQTDVIVRNSLKELRARRKDLKDRLKELNIYLARVTTAVANDPNYQNLLAKIKEIKNKLKEAKENIASLEAERIKNKYLYFIKPLLIPPSVYFANAPLCSVKFVLDKDIEGDYVQEEDNTRVKIPKGTVLWSQPIYIYQDNYPSTTLNKWNGKDIQTDNDTGTITANGLAAGKKESDNTFTGVVLGDWSRTDSDKMLTSQTGVYGFNHGAMSYALKDDGTAFFGKDGRGRIYFNGQTAQIYSASWITPKIKENKTGEYDKTQEGMLLDIDDGYILMKDLQDRQTSKIQITGSKNETLIRPGYLNISVNNGTSIMKVSNTEYFLQSKNFDDKNETGVNFNLNNGRITGYDFKIKAIQTIDNKVNKIIINSNADTWPLKIGTGSDNKGDFDFKVSWAGKLVASNVNVGGNIDASSGTLGDWIINDRKIKSNNSAIVLSAGDRTDPNGAIRVGNYGDAYHIKLSGDGTFSIKDSNGKKHFEADTSGKVVIGSNDNSKFTVNSDGSIAIGNNFSVDTQGNITTTGTITATTLTATNGGKIGNWNIGNGGLSRGTISAGTISGGTIVGGTIKVPDDNNPNFKVSARGILEAKGVDITGKIKATSGQIGGWYIKGSKIQDKDSQPDITLDASGDAEFGYTTIEHSGVINVGSHIKLESMSDNNNTGKITVKHTSDDHNYVIIDSTGVYVYNSSHEIISCITENQVKVRIDNGLRELKSFQSVSGPNGTTYNTFWAFQ